MATLRKRSKVWEVQIRRRGFPGVTRTFPTKVDASAWAAVIESEMARGIFVDRSELERTTFGDLLRRYETEITVHKKGADSEKCRIAALLCDPIAQLLMPQVTSQRLAQWRDQRLLAVTGSTVNRDLNLFSHVINVARKEWGLPMDNPVALIRRPKQNRARTRRLMLGEEDALLSQLAPSQRSISGAYEPGGSRNPYVYALVQLAIETAMRRSELLSLTWDNVYLDHCYVHLVDTKNGDARDVPLSQKAMRIVADLPRDKLGHVFPVSAAAVKKVFERAVVRAGLQDFHFHDLRHEGTSRIATKLDNVLELSAVTGHKTVSMLKRYYHPRASDLAKKLG